MGSNPIRVTNFYAPLERHTYGGLAQLGEHLPYKQRVGGSNPSASTIIFLIFVGDCGHYIGIYCRGFAKR
jgi:hypothetical protein